MYSRFRAHAVVVVLCIACIGCCLNGEFNADVVEYCNWLLEWYSYRFTISLHRRHHILVCLEKKQSDLWTKGLYWVFPGSERKQQPAIKVLLPFRIHAPRKEMWVFWRRNLVVTASTYRIPFNQQRAKHKPHAPKRPRARAHALPAAARPVSSNPAIFSYGWTCAWVGEPSAGRTLSSARTRTASRRCGFAGGPWCWTCWGSPWSRRDSGASSASCSGRRSRYRRRCPGSSQSCQALLAETKIKKNQ